MEFTTVNSNHEELAEATRGAWGKDVLKDCSFVYFGQGVIGIGDSVEILDKNVKCNHYDWHPLGNRVYFAIVK